MSNLIVGHVTSSSARIWVRGEKGSKEARLRHRKRGTAAWTTEPPRPLVEFRGFVEVFDLAGLSAGSAYECELSYKTGKAPAVDAATFTTAPASPGTFSFLLGSCNWSRGGLIKIGNAKESWEGLKVIVEDRKPSFLIHAGDQIYSDVIFGPLPKDMHLPYYRSLYQKAWNVRPTAEVLAMLPNYMILDDHEIFDDFFNGKPYAGEASDTIRDFAKAAYREYQDWHNPQDFAPDFYYSFEWAGARFFALDVRTERHQGAHPAIIGTQQMERFQAWLLANAGAVKFVVTSVPFVGQGRTGDDKWNGPSFRAQRDELIDFIAKKGIAKLVFLTGDMHCSYHATMSVAVPGGPSVVHELMSSPINQVANGIHGFVTDLSGTTQGGTSYQVKLDPAEFYGTHSNVMQVQAAVNGKIDWKVYRTKGVQSPPVSELAGTFQL
jgi:hypothetical protein